MRTVLSSIAVVAAAVTGAPALAAQETGAFVVRLGSDTVSLEQYTRTPTALRGDQVLRTPRSVHRIYRADLDADGSVRRFELITHNISGDPGPAETRLTVDYQGDTAVVRLPQGDSTVTMRVVGAERVAPFIVHVYGLIEQLLRQARARGGDVVALKAVTPGQAQPWTVTTTRVGTGAYSLMLGPIGPWSAQVDTSGRLVGLSGKSSTLKVEVERVASVDLAASGPAFAARSLGPLSPRDTARATLGGADLWVDYGRPQKRGRVIFGNIVPWGVVWRTGANAATQLFTPVALTVGGLAVPAGTYTLWTVPAPTGWTLIINKQHGQWGTVYQADQDLGRVELRLERLSQPVEQLTITLESRGAGGVLAIAWDQTRAEVPFAKK
jgi:hypothetical protein